MTVISHPQNATEEMLHFTRLLIVALVEDPQAVEVSAISGTFSTTLRVTVAAADLGKVIGKQGRTARSLRILIAAAGIRLQQRFELDIRKID
ncbi:KH domain-containing protein [Granulicella tundricola]|uniref:RNA-binding protein KhpA n=1 Tax=Granulicella tundricola (strain ATCC BAA-1859 / DSM 23138 / MP5ACTX9) TaxID=1198114 RepID=E8X5K3_GRATM|nr:KH domain-containing protein [Granulicella tundricola]ADW70630.1 hypothetical protein AciX9_3627 [Granulicella tundricola MP5ACTX9]